MDQFVRKWGKLKQTISFVVDSATEGEIKEARAAGVEVGVWLRSLLDQHRVELRALTAEAKRRSVRAI